MSMSKRKNKRWVKSAMKNDVGFRKLFLRALLTNIKEYPHLRVQNRQAYNLFR